MDMTVEHVHEALAEQDYGTALKRAIEAWRHNPAPAIAAAVQRIDERALEGFDAPKGRSNADFQKAWLACARGKSVVATGWLAKNLTVKVAEDVNASHELRRYKAQHARLTALAKRGRDPRIVTALLQVLDEGAHEFLNWKSDKPKGEGVYLPCLDALVSQHDPSVLIALDRIRLQNRAKSKKVREYFKRAIPKYIKRLQKDPPAAADDALAADWEAVLRQGPSLQQPDPVDESELLEAIYENPDDDRARMVYADFLQERGDPRGELIALQLAGDTGTKKQARENARRARELLKRYKREWLGEALEAVLSGVVFERGFITKATVRRTGEATWKRWGSAARDPRLRTLRELRKGQAAEYRYERFLFAAPHVRHIDAPTGTFLRTVSGSRRHHFESVVCFWPPSASTLALMARSPAFTELKAMRIRLADEAMTEVQQRVHASGLAARLDELAFEA